MSIARSLASAVFGLKADLDVGTKNEKTRVEWIRDRLSSLPAGTRLLDAGAGEQPFRKFCDHLVYVSQDFGKYDPGELDSGLQMADWDYGNLDIVSDIASIPEPDGSFGAILCTEVFEHIVNPREAIREFSRLLKPGGQVLITAPFCSLTHFAPYHFYTGFNRFFYEKELAENGFRITEITPNGNYFEYLAQELRRTSYMAHVSSGGHFTKKEQLASRMVLNALQRFSENDSKTDETLCFGLHVVAVKE